MEFGKLIFVQAIFSENIFIKSFNRKNSSVVIRPTFNIIFPDKSCQMTSEKEMLFFPLTP